MGRAASLFPPLGCLAPGGGLMIDGEKLAFFSSSFSSGGGMGYLPIAISTSDKPKLQISDRAE